VKSLGGRSNPKRTRRLNKGGKKGEMASNHFRKKEKRRDKTSKEEECNPKKRVGQEDNDQEGQTDHPLTSCGE